ncbi:MAG: hypothetical protein KF857_12825 [Fimbriimonadaceae bacterium]|nr:hypothetical protein [Fimbriimonadaceae bacterium]
MVTTAAPALCLASSGKLFDAAVNPDPVDPVWGWHAVGGRSPEASTLDTMADRREMSGWWVDLGQAGAPPDGLDLVVVVDLAKESHASRHRAGLSVALTTKAGKSVVVNLWESEAWLAGDDPLTGKGESLQLRTSGRHEVTIEEAGQSAAVLVDGQRIGRVPLRDLSLVAGVPDGYLKPGSVFFGDASTGAGCQATLRSVTWRSRGVDVDLARAVLSTSLVVAAGGGLVATFLRRRPRERHTGRVYIERR